LTSDHSLPQFQLHPYGRSDSIPVHEARVLVIIAGNRPGIRRNLSDSIVNRIGIRPVERNPFVMPCIGTLRAH
jgi:hypothetical protein